MSVNRNRHVAQCIRCHERPQKFNLLCDWCFEEVFADARDWRNTPTRTVRENTRRPEPQGKQEAAK